MRCRYCIRVGGDIFDHLVFLLLDTQLFCRGVGLVIENSRSLDIMEHYWNWRAWNFNGIAHYMNGALYYMVTVDVYKIGAEGLGRME